jgi:MFS family permease
LVGQAPAAVTLLATVLGLVAGPLAERHTCRVVLEAGLLSVLISALATGLAPAYPAFLGLALVGALGRAMVLPVAQAIGSTACAEEGARRQVLALTSPTREEITASERGAATVSVALVE